jgi:hypothetical protein
MELYIRVEDNKPVGNPILGDNFRQAFPAIDTTNLPPNFARFVRVECPQVGPFEIYEGATYEKVGDVYTDIHHVRAMTPEEIDTKKETIKQEVLSAWALIPNAFNFTAWVYDDTQYCMVAPIPRPVEEGKIFRWSGADNNWKEAPPKPEDGTQYKFDFAQWVWVPING